MGSYGAISFDGLELYGAKNTVYYHMLNLFSPDDYIETEIHDDGEIFKAYKFVTTCKMAKKRLDIIGYHLKKVSDELEENMTICMIQDEDPFDVYPIDLYDILLRFYDFTNDAPNMNLIENMTLENFKKSIKSLFENPHQEIPTGDIILDYILEYKDENYYGVGLPVKDPISEVRVVLEVLNDNDQIEYDLTGIIENGYVDLYGILPFWRSNSYNLVSNKTIILTEGTVDIYVLQKSLNILFPQYKHLYTFFDFDLTKSPGSTGNLVNLIKGFVNAGIKERIIALFDNDTAAYEALSILEVNKLTMNIRVLHLPNLDWAMNYPTIGPTGEVKTNINGLACSIEMFMGKNLLQKEGKYIPVQWTGYNTKLKRYQGEILYKKEIFNNFREVVKQTEKGTIDITKHDWEQLKYLWETIFDVYN